MPLYKLLGGFRDSVPTYVAGGYYEEDKGLKGLAEEMVYNEANEEPVCEGTIARIESQRVMDGLMAA
ncbi:MAG: hypothetical protein ACYC3S_17835 [Chloroflexota bacterium]